MSNPMLEQFALLYGEPKTSDVAAFVASYANAMRNVDDETLRDAADIVIRTRTIKAWPTIAVCLDAIADARKRSKERGLRLEPIDDWDGWFGGLMAQVRHANTQAEIDGAVAKVLPYCKAQWCFPSRADELRSAGVKRMDEMRRSPPVRDPTGEAV